MCEVLQDTKVDNRPAFQTYRCRVARCGGEQRSESVCISAGNGQTGKLTTGNR